MIKCAAVVPTCRQFTIPDQTIEVRWYIVSDREQRPVDGPHIDIVAPDKMMYGERCSSIRSAGFMQAIRDGATHVLTVDDDCWLPPTWAEQHVAALDAQIHPWSPTVPGVHTRGTPYNPPLLKVAVTHGLWDGIQDLDGETQKQWEDAGVEMHCRQLSNGWHRIHPPFAQCSMNYGFTREVAPVMYQPAQGPDFAYNRFDDIWQGVLCQRALTLHDYAFMNGGAIVYHQRASNTENNIKNESAGKTIHEHFWKYVWGFRTRCASLTNTYLALASHVADFKTGDAQQDVYFTSLARNMKAWVEGIYDSYV